LTPIPLKKSFTSDQLYKIAKKEKDAKVRSRILGIAASLEGKSRTQAAKIAGLNLNIFRIWIKRYNENGLEGLRSIKQTGRPKKLSPEKQEILRQKILNGADFEKDGRIRFRLLDIQDYLRTDHQIDHCQSSIWYILKDLGLSWISVRPKHPKTTDEAIQEFKNNFKKKPKL
jgi:transposase